MNGSVINHILTSNPYTKHWYNGFSSPDLPLPHITKYPSLIVLNTDTTDGPGEHWCILIVFNNDEAEFFDSYGQSPQTYNFHNSIFEHVKKIKYNTRRVQGKLPTCGHHCLFYSVLRANGFSLNNIMSNKYSENLFNNDVTVFNFIKNSYGELYAKFCV